MKSALKKWLCWIDNDYYQTCHWGCPEHSLCDLDTWTLFHNFQTFKQRKYCGMSTSRNRNIPHRNTLGTIKSTRPRVSSTHRVVYPSLGYDAVNDVTPSCIHTRPQTAFCSYGMQLKTLPHWEVYHSNCKHELGRRNVMYVTQTQHSQIQIHQGLDRNCINLKRTMLTGWQKTTVHNKMLHAGIISSV